MTLDLIINETVANRTNSGNRIIGEQHDSSRINWVRGMTDPGEMIGCGRYQELRRHEGESDADYANRLPALLALLPVAHREKIETAMRSGALQRANLYSRNGKIAVAVAGEAPWHGLGVNVSDAMTSTEALELASLAGWDLRKIQQQIDWDGRLIPVDGSYAIVRPSDGKILGSVGERYEIFSNESAFAFIDSVLSASGAKYESAGAIDNGSRIWCLAKLPQDIAVAPGDELRQFLLLGSSHDGSSAVWVVPTNERVVCANTYRIAMGGRKSGYYFRHTKNISSKSREVAKALGLAQVAEREFADHAATLAKAPLVDSREFFMGCLDNIVDVTIAGQRVTSASYKDGTLLAAITELTDKEQKAAAESSLERCIKRRGEILNDILERHESETCNGIPSIAGSVWSAANAVTEFLDHSPLQRYRGSIRERAESRFQSTLLGQAADLKDSVLDLAMNYASN